MTDKVVYSSGKDPLSGCDMLYYTEGGKRNGILAASAAEGSALSPAAVMKAAASLLNGQMPDVVSLPDNRRLLYARPQSGNGIVLHVKDGGQDGLSVPSVAINSTGSSPDLAAATLSKMNQEFMARMCGMFDGMAMPAPQAGTRPDLPPAPRA